MSVVDDTDCDRCGSMLGEPCVDPAGHTCAPHPERVASDREIVTTQQFPGWVDYEILILAEDGGDQ